MDATTGTVQARKQRGEYRTPKHEYIIAPGHRDGYYRICICGFRALEHKVVWFALKGPIPEGLTVNHKDGNKLNNHPENLELLTHQENTQHAINTGLYDPHAPKNWSLTEEQVREIRRRVMAGEKQKAVAQDMGTTPNIVCRIMKRKMYSSVK